MDAPDEVRAAAVQLTADERTALEAAAGRGRGRVAQVAAILLACAGGDPDSAVASRLAVSVRTVGRWRQRFRAEGLDVLGNAGRSTADDVVRAAIMDDGPAGHVPTTRTTATRLRVSQATVSRAWRTAGVRPLPSGLLIGDPWFRGRVRMPAGFAVFPSPNPGSSVAGAGSTAGGPRRALAYWVTDQPSTPRRREAEDALVTVSRDRDRLWDAAAGWCRATEELASRPRAESRADDEGAAGLAEFVREMTERRPPGSVAWVLLDGPAPAVADSAAAEKGEAAGVEVRGAPSGETWAELAVRSLAASAAVVEARGMDSSVARMESAARLMLADPSASGPLWWREDPERVSGMLPRLRQRRPSPPRRTEVPRLSPAEAVDLLRDAHGDEAAGDLPPFELLLRIRRAAGVRIGEKDVAAAHTVLAGLMLDCDVLEAALLAYCRQPHVQVDPWLVARRLGVTTLHAVGRRARARTAGAAAGRPSAASPALPDPRATVRLDDRGRVRDVVAETVEGLLELWREDLVDHEHLVEQLPAADDRFGILAWLVHPDRPVLVDWRPDRPGPQARHQAAADAGLIVLADLRHRLREEQRWWYRAGVELGVSWRVQGEPYGRQPNAALQHWKRLEQRARLSDTAPERVRRGSDAWWAGREDAIAGAVASVQEHRGVFEADEDLGMYAWWLEEGSGPVPLLGFIEDFAALRCCRDCGEDRTMVVRDEHGWGRCPAHGGHRGLAATVDRLLPFATELKALRRGTR